MSVAPGRRPRVAVIDDEPDVLTFLRLALEDAGFEVLTSGSPAEVLSELASFGADVICLDLLMPERMGLSLFVEIRRTPSMARVPVVILSGLAGDALAALDTFGDLLPPAFCFEKPVDLGAFVA
ncbi:MAG: response regulator, partial [Acidobacteriota bacterium]